EELEPLVALEVAVGDAAQHGAVAERALVEGEVANGHPEERLDPLAWDERVLGLRWRNRDGTPLPARDPEEASEAGAEAEQEAGRRRVSRCEVGTGHSLCEG